jgi:hypothetical protein
MGFGGMLSVQVGNKYLTVMFSDIIEKYADVVSVVTVVLYIVFAYDYPLTVDLFDGFTGTFL